MNKLPQSSVRWSIMISIAGSVGSIILFPAGAGAILALSFLTVTNAISSIVMEEKNKQTFFGASFCFAIATVAACIEIIMLPMKRLEMVIPNLPLNFLIASTAYLLVFTVLWLIIQSNTHSKLAQRK